MPAIIWVLAFVYAALRYVVAGDVAAIHLPAYILNKAVALSACVYLVLSGWNTLQGNQQRQRLWSRLFLHMAVIHVLLSVALMSPQVYHKFYHQDALTLKGELVLLFGVLAAYACWLLRQQPQLLRLSLVLLTVSLGAHLMSMGLPGWMQPDNWPASLPPVSLLSFVLVAPVLYLYLRQLLAEQKLAEKS